MVELLGIIPHAKDLYKKGIKIMSTSKMSQLLKAVQKAKSSGSSEREDEYFYYPQVDAAGNGSATIRFLPEVSDDLIPFVKLYSHGFKGPTGKWLIDNCPTTLEEQCPVCDANQILFKEIGKDEFRKTKRSRKTKFYSRIEVVADSKTPENVGKVFRFSYGTVIFDKIVSKLQPEFDDEVACDIFSLSEGANFKLKIRKVDGQTNYDKSEFDAPSVRDENIMKLCDESNDIQKYVAKENFKTPEKILEYFNKAIGNTDRLPAAKKASQEFDDDIPDVVSQPKSNRTEVKKGVVDAEDDDVMALINSLTE